MIELKDDRLLFTFPEVHRSARLSVNFQRTLRIPDDGKDHFLPPGLGSFPLRHVDDYAASVPASWIEHGGVMLPMYQSEALWVSFSTERDEDEAYPFAVRIATGKIDAVTGETWKKGIRKEPQNYLAVPPQPWLDGYCVEKGVIRQFVAMPLGSGYTAEEQVTGKAEHGGLQILVHPMKADAFRLLQKERAKEAKERRRFFSGTLACCMPSADMGLAPGGRMRQEIYDDPFGFADWDRDHTARCFVHIANSMVWQSVTGSPPPTPPPTAAQYSKAGLPWFDFYADGQTALSGSKVLSKLKSVKAMGKKKGDSPLPEGESATPKLVVTLRAGLEKGQVREGAF